MTWAGILTLDAVVLFFIWRVMAATFALIEHWHAAAAESREDPATRRGTVSSALQQQSSSSSLH